MGRVMIQNYTCKNPITMIGFEAGICWGADTADEKKNYRRGLDCLESGHGRTFASVDKGIHNKTTKYGLPTY